MDSFHFVLLSETLTFGVPLALACRELLVLRRERRDDNGDGGHRRDAPPPRPKPLPGCLDPILPDVQRIAQSEPPVLEPA